MHTSKCPPQRPRAANQQHRRQPKRLSPQLYAFVELHAAVAVVHLHTWNSRCELRMNDTSCEYTLRVCLQDDLRLLHSIRAERRVRCKCFRDSRMLMMNSLRQLTPKLTPHTSQRNTFTHRIQDTCELCPVIPDDDTRTSLSHHLRTRTRSPSPCLATLKRTRLNLETWSAAGTDSPIGNCD